MAESLPGVDSDSWRGANILDPEHQQAFRADPHPFLAHLRAVDPVNETPLGVWRLTRYDDVVRLLRDVPAGVRFADGRSFGAAPSDDDGSSDFLLSQDPPNHTRLRKLVSKAFTPRAVEKLRPRVQAITDALLDEAIAQGDLDVIRDLALPVPATVICEMLGVPVAERDRFTEWTSRATHLLARQTAPPEVVARGEAASESLAEYFDSLIAQRRRSPGDDLLSNLIRAEEEGDRLSASELLSQAIGLLIAGFETTIGLIGNGVLALIRHPAELAKLRANPALIGSAVEECLRYDGPIVLTVRILHEDAAFGDRVIPVDTMVWAMLAAANRDPEQFPDPDRFDIERDATDHVAFGGGMHFCLGHRLAEMEAQVAIGGLVRRFRDLRLRSEMVEWGESLFRVPGSLPVTFAPI